MSDADGGAAVILLEYVRETHHPTRRGNLRLVVDADGSARLQSNDGDPPPGQRWQEASGRKLGQVPDPERWLHALLLRHGFFAMPPLRNDARVRGGVCETLSWHGRDARTVLVDRSDAPDFTALIGALFVVLTVG